MTSTKNKKSFRTGNPLMAFERLILSILTGDHPEKANDNLKLSLKNVVIVVVLIIIVALVVYYAVTHTAVNT